MDAILHAVLPYILEIVGSILAAIAGAVLLAARQWLTAKLGADTTKALADMLHRALETGAQAAVAANPGAQPGDLIADAIAHAQVSIPDTLERLAPSPEALANIARAKVAQAISWASFGKV